MEDVLLKDFAPETTLVTEEHVVRRPRFPAIDAHSHLGFLIDAFGDSGSAAYLAWGQDVGALVGTMDDCGIRAIGNLTGRWGDELGRLIDRYEGAYPSRFFTFANVDWTGAGEPGFGERAARQLEDSVRAGARGLKVFKNLGLRVADASGRLLRPDDERLDPLWARAGELGVPVLIHVADPVSFFTPLDARNEAYLELKEHPDWHFFGPRYPIFLELVEAGIRLMARHSGTTFITAHTGWYSENLKYVGERMLDRLPNMYTDFSARLNFLGRQPNTARRFFLKYQDRIVFGTDGEPTPETYQVFFRFLETADDHFSMPGRRGIGSRMCGIDLPDEVLEKVYHRNVERLVRGLA